MSKLEETPQGRLARGAIILPLREPLERILILEPHGALKIGDRLRIPHVLFAPEAPLVVPGIVELAADRLIALGIAEIVASQRLVGDVLEGCPWIRLALTGKGRVHNLVGTPTASKIWAPL